MKPKPFLTLNHFVVPVAKPRTQTADWVADDARAATRTRGAKDILAGAGLGERGKW